MLEENLTRISCKMSECNFYVRKKGETQTYCNHPEKPHYMTGSTCPLFRLDIAKKMSNIEEKLKNKLPM